MTLYFIVARMPNAEFIQTTQTPGSESISAANDTRAIFVVVVISCMRATDFSSLARCTGLPTPIKNYQEQKVTKMVKTRNTSRFQGTLDCDTCWCLLVSTWLLISFRPTVHAGSKHHNKRCSRQKRRLFFLVRCQAKGCCTPQYTAELFSFLHFE